MNSRWERCETGKIATVKSDINIDNMMMMIKNDIKDDADDNDSLP